MSTGWRALGPGVGYAPWAPEGPWLSSRPQVGLGSGEQGTIQSPQSQPQVAPLCLRSCLSLPTAPQMLPQHRALPLESSPNQFSLYTSPSLPNISLGLQATVTVTNSHLTVSMDMHLVLSGVGFFSPGCPQLELWSSRALREIRDTTSELGGGQG